MNTPLNIRIRRSMFEGLMSHLHQEDGNEHHAFLLCGVTRGAGQSTLLVREVHAAGPDDIESCSPTYVSLKPDYFLRVVDRCQRLGLHIVDVHSHPFATNSVQFSGTDLRSAQTRFKWHEQCLPNALSAGLVFAQRAVDGHYWDKESSSICSIQALEIMGDRLDIWTPDSTKVGTLPASSHYDRQVRAFGSEFQQVVSRLRIGVVGLGGTGSHVVQQLAYLGVQDFVLIDPDQVEATNLNRLVGATPEDVDSGTFKTEVAKRAILQIQPTARVSVSATSLLENPPADVGSCQVVFGCTDNDAARFFLSVMSRRCLWLYCDMGTGIKVDSGRIRSVGGQVAVTHADSFSLACSGLLSQKGIEAGRRTSEERQMVESVYGSPEPAPAVVSLNGVLAAVAVQELIKRLGQWGTPCDLLRYDSMRGVMEPWLAPSSCGDDCLICAAAGAGDQRPASASETQRIPVANLMGA